jgi:hypothetical protein
MATKPKHHPHTTGKPTSRRTAKKARLVRLLKAKTGCEISKLSRELGWQPHSIRAALTGLRKAGYGIERLPPGKNGGSRYRITCEPETSKP